MELSRRAVVQSGLAAGAVGFTGSLLGSLSETAVAAPRSGMVPRLTTLDSTLVRGAAGPGGYTPIVLGPPDGRVVREGLGVSAAADRAACRTPMIAFAQLSDVHIVDYQSPMRVEWTDRFDDPGTSGAPTVGLFASAYRAQEALSAHVSDAMVHAINQIEAGPVSGLPLEFSIMTGDNSDNSQYNEIRWNIDVLDGEEVTANSGAPNTYEGVQDNNALYYDTHYWHPEGTPAGKPDDDLRANRGFPEIPGFFAAARRPFTAQGLNHEWYSAFGNHDGLVQGNFPTRTLPLELLSTGVIKIFSPPAGVTQANLLDAITAGNLSTLLDGLTLTPYIRLVTADPDRRTLSRAEIVEEHFNTTGTPVGHGFTADNRAAGTAYYSFTKGDFCFIVMDTVNPNGYADGSLDQAQFTWIQQTVAANTDKAVILFSHHTSETMSNPLIVTGGDPSPRVLGGDLVDFLLTQEHVIAWINGHTHTNQIWARANIDGSDGFWEINTASHIDFPQQSRLIEIVDNGDDTMSIFTTMIDHAGPASHGGDLSNTLSLASLSRELAANDPQERNHGREGTPEDRTTELVVRMPAALRAEASCDDDQTTPDDDDTPAGPDGGETGTGGTGTGTGGTGGTAGGPTETPGAGVLPDTGLPAGLTGVAAAGLTAVMAGETLVRYSRKGDQPDPSA